jgi:hypothetical protein
MMKQTVHIVTAVLHRLNFTLAACAWRASVLSSRPKQPAAHICLSPVCYANSNLLTTSRLQWKDNIKIILKKIEWDVVDWIHLAQDRDQWRAVVNTVMNLRVTENSGYLLSSLAANSFSRKGSALWSYWMIVIIRSTRRSEMRVIFWLENVGWPTHVQEINMKMYNKQEQHVRVWTAFVWLRIGPNVELLWTR